MTSKFIPKHKQNQILTIFCVGPPAPCPALHSMRRPIIGLVCGLFSKHVLTTYCKVLKRKIGHMYTYTKWCSIGKKKDKNDFLGMQMSLDYEFHSEKRLTANSFNKCNGTTLSSWSAVNSMVGAYWWDWLGCCSHGLLTLCRGEYLKVTGREERWAQKTPKASIPKKCREIQK